MKKKIQVGNNHHFKLELNNSGLNFVQDENNFIYSFLQVGSGSDEKSNGSGVPKINGSDGILIPAVMFRLRSAAGLSGGHWNSGNLPAQHTQRTRYRNMKYLVSLIPIYALKKE